MLIVVGALLLQTTFASRTVVVVVPVSVSGAGGHPLEGLSKEQFRLYDDGRLQTITTFARGDGTLTLGLVVDRSASMRLKLPSVIDAVDGFAQLARPQDEWFVVDFNERVHRQRFGNDAFTSDATAVRGAVSGLRAAGATALHDALLEGGEQLRHGTADRKALVVVSDGADNASRHTYEDVVTLMRGVGAVVYAIGLSAQPDDKRSFGELQRLAQSSAGKAYLLRSPAEMSAALADIVRDLRDQYLLGFVPEKADSATGVIRVTADVRGHAKVTIRSRTSYAVAKFAP